MCCVKVAVRTVVAYVKAVRYVVMCRGAENGEFVRAIRTHVKKI